MGWTTDGSDFESRLKQDFPLFHTVQTASAANPASDPVETWNLWPGVRCPVLGAGLIRGLVKDMDILTLHCSVVDSSCQSYSPGTSSEVKSNICISAPTYAFMQDFIVLLPVDHSGTELSYRGAEFP
jgi:hypothetical protein